MKLKLSLIALMIIGNNLIAKDLPPGINVKPKPNVLFSLDTSGSMKYSQPMTIGKLTDVIKTKNSIIVGNSEEVMKDIYMNEIHNKYGSINIFTKLSDENINLNLNQNKETLYIYEDSSDTLSKKCVISSVKSFSSDVTDSNPSIFILSNNFDEYTENCHRISRLDYNSNTEKYELSDYTMTPPGNSDNIMMFNQSGNNKIIFNKSGDENKHLFEYNIDSMNKISTNYEDYNIGKEVLGMGVNTIDNILYLSYKSTKTYRWKTITKNYVASYNISTEDITKEEIIGGDVDSNVLRNLIYDSNNDKLIINLKDSDDNKDFEIFDIQSNGDLDNDSKTVEVKNDNENIRLQFPSQLTLIDDKIYYKPLNNRGLYYISTNDLYNNNEISELETETPHSQLSLGSDVEEDTKWSSLVYVMNKIFSESDVTDKMNMGFLLWSDKTTLEEKETGE